MNEIITQLYNYLDQTNQNKSIYWKKILNVDNLNIEDQYKNFGFGSFEKKSLIRSFFHFVFSRIFFGLNIFRSKEYYNYKKIFDKMNRQIDVDVIRHIFTFINLKKKLNPKNICVIGDGKANFVIGCSKIFPNAKIISVNLTEVLIHDYLILRSNKVFEDRDIKVVSNKKDLDSINSKLFLIPSNNKHLLNDAKIDLFINMVSFQEMTFEEVQNYFSIIKNNKSYLYCCNREKKELPNGEFLIFENYPWENAKIEFLELCPWHQKYYSFRYPFFKKYDGAILHCLAKF